MSLALSLAKEEADIETRSNVAWPKVVQVQVHTLVLPASICWHTPGMMNMYEQACLQPNRCKPLTLCLRSKAESQTTTHNT